MPKKESRVTDVYKTKKNTPNFRKGRKDKDLKEPCPSTSKVDIAEEKDFVLLKDFDLNWEYGPSMGITRLERWNRAEKHGLNPSEKVKQLIESHPEDEKYTKCLWNDYKNIM